MDLDIPKAHRPTVSILAMLAAVAGFMAAIWGRVEHVAAQQAAIATSAVASDLAAHKAGEAATVQDIQQRLDRMEKKLDRALDR